MGVSRPLAERFWEKVLIADGCWEWQANRHRFGYGIIALGQKLLKAHRVSWEIHNGPIPEGLWVLHHCDNGPCVRPDHLFLGTALDNARDAVSKGRYRSAFTQPPPSTKLDVTQAREIKELLREGLPMAKIAARYGVTHGAIWKISKGRTWRAA